MRHLLLALLTATALPCLAAAQDLPTGQRLTPLAAPGARFEPLVSRTGPNPAYIADGAAAIARSPDGREMLVLTSGYNRYNGADGKTVAAQSVQYVFRYAIDRRGSRWLQTLTVPTASPASPGCPAGAGSWWAAASTTASTCSPRLGGSSPNRASPSRSATRRASARR